MHFTDGSRAQFILYKYMCVEIVPQAFISSSVTLTMSSML